MSDGAQSYRRTVIDLGPRYENAYGCVACQRYHFACEEVYESHLFFQDKHGIATHQRHFEYDPIEHRVVDVHPREMR